MPKVTDTRKQRAKMLYDRVQRGPSFDMTFAPALARLTPNELEAWLANRYRLWAQSWVLSELTDLVPELRSARRDKAGM